MNRIKILISFVVLLVLASCNKDPELPVVLFDDLEKGAYPRLLDFEGSLVLTDVNNSSITFSVEFYDENNGQNVDSYSWGVAYDDKTGNNDKSEVPLTTVPKSSFTTNPDSGLPMTTITWSFQDILDAFGFTVDSINGADEFNFTATLRKNDGKEFTTINTGDNIESSAPFSGFFRFGMAVICTSDLAGMYEVHTEYIQHDFIATEWMEHTMMVEITDEGDANYSVTDFSGGLYEFGPYVAAYGTTGFPVTFTDACGKITWSNQSDPWGPVSPLAGGVNEVDLATGVITISWFCEGYGESGVSVYTPQ